VLDHRDTIPLAADGADTVEERRWTTTGLINVERLALALAEHLRGQPAGSPAPDLVEDHGRNLPLSDEQHRMVTALTRTGGLAVVVGPAGAGKTAALKEATRAWHAAGRPVAGAAVAAVTARRRSNVAGGHPAALVPGGVLVVDEASMVDTRTLAALLAATRATHGTLVLVGDPAQLPEIGAGGLFAALARHPETITLTDNRRQAEPWERCALAELPAR